jgi:hypothetical protein
VTRISSSPLKGFALEEQSFSIGGVRLNGKDYLKRFNLKVRTFNDLYKDIEADEQVQEFRKKRPRRPIDLDFEGIPSDSDREEKVEDSDSEPDARFTVRIKEITHFSKKAKSKRTLQLPIPKTKKLRSQNLKDPYEQSI